jgi:presenilin-like A22 family membrane protease
LVCSTLSNTLLLEAAFSLALDQILRALAGLTGGLVGSALMALGIALLPAGPRKAAPWLPMLVTGAVAGSLLALDTALGSDRRHVRSTEWLPAPCAE